jgi:hypothetical protein
VKSRIKLVLNWYELTGKNLIAEEKLTGISIDEILALFDAPFWNGLYHCWAVDKQHIGILQPHVKHIIQPQLYAYFIEAININPDK